MPSWLTHGTSTSVCRPAPGTKFTAANSERPSPATAVASAMPRASVAERAPPMSASSAPAKDT